MTASNEFAQVGMQFLAEAEAEAAEQGGDEGGAEPSGQTDSVSSDVDAQAAELAKDVVKNKQTTKPKNGAPAQVQKPAAPPPADPNVWKPKPLKVNGKEYTPRNVQELEAMAARGYAFMQRAEDITRLHEETTTTAKRMQEDLGGYLRELYAKDPQKAADVAEQLLLERAQLAELERQNPAAAQAYRLQKELERRDALDKQRQEQIQQQEQQQLAQQQDEQLDRILDQTLTEANLPRTTPTVRTMGHLLRLSLAKGIELTPQELAQETRNVLDRTYGEYFDGMADDAILEMLGPKRTERIRKALVARAQRGTPRPDAKPVRPTPKASTTDWRAADAKEKDDFEREINALKRQAAKEMFRR